MEKTTLINALRQVDGDRARSKQTAIGVSALGDCRRKVWHMSQGDKKTNSTLSLPAIMGTAIHTAIEAAILTQYEDRDESHMPMLEHRVEIEGLPPATIDFFDPLYGEVVDWKTITLKNVDWFVSQQKRWQVQVYGYLLVQAGFYVKNVTLVGIPRDGTENDIVVHTEPYSEDVALQALAWLEDVKGRTTAPDPERDPITFCAKYCSFYGDLCKGIPKDLSGQAIVDENASNAAKRYIEVNEALKVLEAEKDAVKSALEGFAGVTMDGVKVSWSEVAGRKTPDTDEILRLLQTHVDEKMELPVKVGQPSVRLSVK